jgi:hypothetical protein
MGNELNFFEYPDEYTFALLCIKICGIIFLVMILLLGD